MVTAVSLRYRHRLRIERATDSPDRFGGVTKTWTLFAEVYGDVSVTSSREEREGGGYVERTAAVFRTRYLAGVTSDMRIVYGGRTFLIMGVVDRDERNEQLEITAEETTRG